MSCQKTVIDFTNKSDREIRDILRKNSNACGRFNESQLNRRLEKNPTSSQKWFHYGAIATFMGFSLQSFSQKSSYYEWENRICVLGDTTSIKHDTSQINHPKTNNNNKEIVQFKIVNEDKTPIFDVLVLILNQDSTVARGYKSNFDGEVQINIQELQKVGESAVIQFRASGYYELQNYLWENIPQPHPVEIIMSKYTFLTSGIIGLVGYKKPTIKQRLTKPFRRTYRFIKNGFYRGY